MLELPPTEGHVGPIFAFLPQQDKDCPLQAGLPLTTGCQGEVLNNPARCGFESVGFVDPFSRSISLILSLLWCCVRRDSSVKTPSTSTHMAIFFCAR